MNNASTPLFSSSHPFPLMGLTLALFVHVARQKASGPLRGTCLTKPAYWHSSSLLLCFFFFFFHVAAVTGQDSCGAKSTCRI